jgi:hypothetical protein
MHSINGMARNLGWAAPPKGEVGKVVVGMPTEGKKRVSADLPRRHSVLGTRSTSRHGQWRSFVAEIAPSCARTEYWLGLRSQEVSIVTLSKAPDRQPERHQCFACRRRRGFKDATMRLAINWVKKRQGRTGERRFRRGNVNGPKDDPVKHIARP